MFSFVWFRLFVVCRLDWFRFDLLVARIVVVLGCVVVVSGGFAGCLLLVFFGLVPYGCSDCLLFCLRLIVLLDGFRCFYCCFSLCLLLTSY